MDPAFQGLEKQIKLSKELEPLTLEKTVERVQAKSSTLSTLLGGTKAIVSDVSKLTFGTGFDFARDKLGYNKVQEELIRKVEESKNEDQLNTHIREAFDKTLRGETFDLLVDFAKQMYAIEETAGRFDENHAEQLPDQFKNTLTSFGFKRLHSDPEFKKMLTNMLVELGVSLDKDVKSENLLATLYYMKPEALREIRDRFIEGKPDPNNFPRAKDILFKEYHALSQNIDKHKGSENYFGLLSIHIRALEEIESKQRLANISNLLPNIDTLLGYDPKKSSGLGLMDFMKKNARNVIQTRLPTLINPLLNNVKKTRLEAQALSEDLSAAMRETQTKRMNDEGYKRTKQNIDKTTTKKRETQWEQAYKDVTKERSKAKPPKEGELSHAAKVSQVVLNEFAKEWDKRALVIFNNILQVITPQLYDQMKQELIKANVANEVIQQFDKVFQNSDKKMLSSLTHQELVTLQLAISTGLNGMLNMPENPKNTKDPGKPYFEKANADEKQFILLASNAVGNLGTSNMIPSAIAKLYDELLVKDRAKLDTSNPGTLEKLISGYFSEKIAIALEDTFAGPSKLLEYYVKEKQGKNFVSLVAKESPKSEPQSWKDYLWGLGKKVADKTGLTLAAGALGSVVNFSASAVKETSVISYNTVSSWMAGKEGMDNKTLNKIIIDNTHKAVKEQTFNAFFDMMQKMYVLQEMTKRFDQSFPSKNPDDNPFNKLGLKKLGQEHKKMKENNFLEKVARSLGFMPEEGVAIESLAYADSEKRAKLLAEFCDPKNADKLMLLREAVLTEYQDIQKGIGEGKLESSGNYVAMILAMNQILSNVNKIYQATTAAELYLPDLGAKLGVDSKSDSLYTHLMEQVTHRGSENLAGSGVAYVMQSGITQCLALTEEVLKGSQLALSKEIESRISLNSRHSLTPHLETHQQQSDEKGKKEPPTLDPQTKPSIKP